MHIYDVTNPQGFFCQSKADVKYKQHLVLLKTIYSLPSSLLFVLLPYQWQLATVGKPSAKKRNVKGLKRTLIIGTLAKVIRLKLFLDIDRYHREVYGLVVPLSSLRSKQQCYIFMHYHIILPALLCHFGIKNLFLVEFKKCLNCKLL